MTWVNWFGFIAGIGIFLFAMHQLETALHSISGSALRNMLQKATGSPVGSILSGTFSTAILQSSSMVGLMVLAMVGSGLLPLYNGIGMVIGANLGTTITGWLVTLLGFKLSLTQFAIPLMGIGAISYMVQLSRGGKTGWGLLLFSLGLLIFGLDNMKTSVAGFAEYFTPADYAGLHSFWFLLLGVVFTAIIQSSSAAMLITLSALSAGMLSIPAAAAIIIGADLGTTSTMLIGGMQGSVNKKRVAMSHVIFNLLTAAFAYLLLLPMLPWLLQVSGLQDPLFSLVAFHSFFNLLGVLVMAPFLKSFSNALQTWFSEDTKPLCKYLVDVPAEPSKVSLQAANREYERLFLLSSELNCRALKISLPSTDSPALLPELDKGFENQYFTLKEINGVLTEFLLDVAAIAGSKLKLQQQKRLKALRKLHYSLKSVKDIREDLMQFELSSVKKIRKISQKRINLEATHIGHIRKLVIGNATQDLDEEIDRILVNAARQHDEFVEQVYELIQTDKLSSKELATLINMSKHIEQCVTGLADSARNYLGSLQR